MSKILVVDFLNLARAVFHAVPELTTSDGRQVNAVKGFINGMSSAIEQIGPDEVIIAVEGGSNWRYDLFSSYKATRPETPPGFKPQIPMIMEFIEAAGMTVVKPESGEADDVLASVVTSRPNDEIFLYTSDKDARGLVSDRVTVVMRVAGIKGLVSVGPAEVKARFDVQPAQMRDYLALVGDTVDNVPGVDKIGEKTAARLLEAYGTGDGIYANLEKLKPKERGLLEAGRANFELSKKLITLDTTIPIPTHAPLGGIDRYDKIVAVIRDFEISAAPRRFLARGQNLVAAGVAQQTELF